MKLRPIVSVLNYRIIIILLESFSVYLLYHYFDFRLNIDFTILSIAIVFPLVFSITSAYNKRQDALYAFNCFRNNIIELSNLYYSVNGISKKKYLILFDFLMDIQSMVIDHLITDSDIQIKKIRTKRKDLFMVLNDDKKFYNEREKDSLIRVKNEIFHSVEKLFSMKQHPTPKSLRSYCLIFIYISPFIYNCQILYMNNIQSIFENFISIIISLLIGFVFMSLYNVQEYIENPFDQKGIDDLNFEHIKINPSEGL